ncbi:DUF6221 family protein [Streptomyces roseicoloratus]|uniref:DUF6221 family protein n=1 Tax=Streptomyces roseicoloratus TaxID=2508722 RepID=UPI001009CF3B|nr:DUF6221 family protein [Streptomyces roseicoloratus]
MDLVEFLTARLDEDERTARGVLWDGSGNELQWSLPFSATIQVGTELFTTDDGAVAEHIARHDPARVLAEVDAKRRILADYERFVAERRRMMGGWDSYPEVSPILAALALPYADHPDYDEAWRP